LGLVFPCLPTLCKTFGETVAVKRNLPIFLQVFSLTGIGAEPGQSHHPDVVDHRVATLARVSSPNVEGRIPACNSSENIRCSSRRRGYT
jgi:hypothetical protein